MMASQVLQWNMASKDRSCRICLGDDSDGELIDPCKCRGSTRWVHAACLERWRRTSDSYWNVVACQTCGVKYSDGVSIEILREWLQRARGSNWHIILCLIGAEYAAQDRRTLTCCAYDAACAVSALRQGVDGLSTKHADLFVGPDAPQAHLLLEFKHALGRALLSDGQLDSAELVLLETLDLSEDVKLSSYIKGDLSRLCAEREQDDQAMVLLDEARAGLRSCGAAPEHALWELGCLYALRGDLVRAISLFREELRCTHAMWGRYTQAYELLNLGVLLYKQGELKESLEIFREALQVSRRTA